MLVCSEKHLPDGAQNLQRAMGSMEIFLHIGAHRTGTTGFQNYMRAAVDETKARDICFWGPGRMRRGLLAGVYAQLGSSFDPPSVSRNHVQLAAQIDVASDKGTRKLVVSDENMMGSIRQNMRQAALYPGVGARLALICEAFDHRVSSVFLSPRSLELYWCSALAFAVAKGLPFPDRQKCAAIANSPRGWRDVITDIARAVPGVEIKVFPFEAFKGWPDAMLHRAINESAPVCRDRSPANPSPALPDLRRALHKHGSDASVLPFGMGRWNPFTNEEHCTLRELYADDMMWLTAGAGGLATLIEDRSGTKAGPNLPPAAHGKGQFDECEERDMARPG